MRSILLWTILLGATLLADSEPQTSSYVEEKSAGHFEWRIALPTLEDINITQRGVEYPGWNLTVDENGFMLPISSKLIYTSSGPPQIEILTGETRTIPVTRELIPVSESVL